MGRYTFWEKLEPTCHTGEAGRTTKHDRPCRCSRPWQVQPTLPRGSCLVQCTSSPAGTTWMNEIHRGNVSLIEWMWLGSLGSMSPLVRLINRHNLYSKAILGVPERRQFITRHRVGPAAPPNHHARWNRPLTTSGAVIRSVQGERWWIIGPVAPLDPAAPMILVPCVQPTSLAYKRHLTLARMDTQRWSISISLFCSLRVRLV
jgi:hypothetical protein